MSLFVINRYEGEEAEESTQKKDRLHDLLKRIEERKRQRAEQNESTAIENSEISEEPVSKKSRKKNGVVKSKSEVEKSVLTDEQGNEDKQTGDQRSKRKKRRKKKLEIDESSKVEDEGNKETVESTEATVQVPGESEDSKDAQKSEGTGDFIVLGVKTKKKKQEVQRVLPDWLAHPEIVPVCLNSGPRLEELENELDSRMIKVLKDNGIDKLFPVQASVLRWLNKCSKDRKKGWWLRDTCVSAPTGSGKTLAYVLPIVLQLQSRLVPKIRCLVVVPVQELAAQVYKVMVKYTARTNLRVGLISGASSFEQEQSTILRKTTNGDYVSSVDIIVATPGRLVDHILKTPGFSLDDLQFLVIDEADRSADWLQHIPEPHYRGPRLTLSNMRNCKPPAQKLLFSATLSQDPEKLSRLGLFQPILFTSVVVSGKDDDVNLDKEVGDFVGRYTTPEELTELAIECPKEYKPLAVYNFLNTKDKSSKSLVFTNSGESAHALASLLRLLFSQELRVLELSSQLAPSKRVMVLKEFAEKEAQVLVCSDALARGVDIPDVETVISYDLPKHIKGYIHRAGRTGRAGKPGTAVTILLPKQVGLFKHMLTNAHRKVPEITKMEYDGLAEVVNYFPLVEKLQETLRKEEETNLQRTKAAKGKPMKK